MIGEISSGKNPFEKKPQTTKTFKDFFNLYMTQHAKVEKKPRSVVEDQRLIDNHLLPRLKRRSPETITSIEIGQIRAKIDVPLER
jgi:hypothetical protein